MPRLEELRTYRRHAEWVLVAATAVELGLIDALDSGPREGGELATSLGLASRGAEVLLGALVELGAVRREGQAFRLTGAGRAFLVDRTCPDYQRPSLLHWLHTVRRWASDLPETVRRGRPPGETGTGSGSQTETLPAFMEAMANKPPGLVTDVVDEILGQAPSTGSLLDLGGGPGSFARAFASRGLRVTLYDRPDVISHVRAAFGLEDVEGLVLSEGDLLQTVPPGPFDVVFVANVTHIYSADKNRELVRRAASAVAPGGLLAILDFVRGRSEFAALFAVTMLQATDGGGTYTLEHYGAWMAEAGLDRIRCVGVAPDTHLITARRAPRGVAA